MLFCVNPLSALPAISIHQPTSTQTTDHVQKLPMKIFLRFTAFPKILKTLRKIGLFQEIFGRGENIFANSHIYGNGENIFKNSKINKNCEYIFTNSEIYGNGENIFTMRVPKQPFVFLQRNTKFYSCTCYV